MTFGISFLAKPIWSLFYGESVYGPSVLSYYIFAGFFISLFTATVTMLQTLKDYKAVFTSLVIGIIFKILLNNNLIQAFYQMGVPPYYGVITASIIGYLVSLIYCVIILNVRYKIRFETLIKNLVDILCGTFLMVLVLILIRFVVPIPSPVRMVNLILILFYAVVGMVVYFGYAYFSKLTNKVFGKEIINTIKKILLKK
jgi:O-antigen/teichoic acid export membrane protein